MEGNFPNSWIVGVNLWSHPAYQTWREDETNCRTFLSHGQGGEKSYLGMSYWADVMSVVWGFQITKLLLACQHVWKSRMLCKTYLRQCISGAWYNLSWQWAGQVRGFLSLSYKDQNTHRAEQKLVWVFLGNRWALREAHVREKNVFYCTIGRFMTVVHQIIMTPCDTDGSSRHEDMLEPISVTTFTHRIHLHFLSSSADVFGSPLKSLSNIYCNKYCNK